MNLKHYIIDPKPVGIGYYGIVYSAYDPIKKMKVAIKKNKVDGGKKEAHIMKQVGFSKYLPVFYDFFIIDDSAYIVMEYLEGKKLGGGFHSEIEKWDEKKGVQITINILKGIEQIHHSGFIHNDVMPKNIMIKDDLPDTIKVFDFNLAKEINSDRLLKDLRNSAEVSIVLMNGVLPKQVTGTELTNKNLMSVLMKAIKPTGENRYHSAQEFIDALLPFS